MHFVFIEVVVTVEIAGQIATRLLDQESVGVVEAEVTVGVGVGLGVQV